MSKSISDSFNLTISVSFLLKILAVTAIVVGSYYQTTSNMANMERTILNSKMAEIEKEHVQELEHYNEELKETNRSLLQRLGLKRP